MRAWAATMCAVLVALPLTAEADGVAALCADAPAPAPVCDCAAAALALEVAQDDYALYQSVGFDYARLRADGERRAAAWEAALTAAETRAGGGVTSVRRRVDAVARTHRAVIRQCTN
ncbi:MAG: hypothetical protein AAGI34_20060 [Pseudomonadota bacterium]